VSRREIRLRIDKVTIAACMATVNLIMALFNLIPGLPLDGGNVLKALVWKITGNLYQGIAFASRAGQAIGWIAVIAGMVPLLSGSFTGIWTLLLGWFLLRNASFTSQAARVQARLSGLTAADAVVPNGPVVQSSLSLREFANEYIVGRNQWQRFLVTDDAGQLVGAIAVDDLKTVSTSCWPDTQVKELMQTAEPTTVKPDQSLLDVVKLLETQKLTQLPVVRDNGVLVGLLEKNLIVDLMKHNQTKPA